MVVYAFSGRAVLSAAVDWDGISRTNGLLDRDLKHIPGSLRKDCPVAVEPPWEPLIIDLTARKRAGGHAEIICDAFSEWFDI